MLLPRARFGELNDVVIPGDVLMRSYRPGDERSFYELMKLADFGEWGDERLARWISRIPPKCWFMILSPNDEIVATAMGLHNHTHYQPFGGELGWVAVRPDFRRKGLGKAVSLAVIQRLISAGYENIHLYTEDYRTAALRLYLSLGFEPYLYDPGMSDRWRQVCAAVDRPFTPKQWRTDT